jgi:hypothetical protein
MKYVACLVALVALGAAPVLAGDTYVPRSTLAAMGLSGLQPLSDAQGLSIRGMGSSRVFGASIAQISDPVQGSAGGAQSEYRASIVIENSLAAGFSVSVASLTFGGQPIPFGTAAGVGASVATAR